MNRANILLLAIVISMFVSAASGEDWVCWRGANHNGVVGEKSGWPENWPPKEAWRRNVGYGCTSPIIVDGKLYVMGWRGSARRRGGKGTDTLYCIDAASGKDVWKQSYSCPYQGRISTGDAGAYGGPSSTPTFDKSTGFLYTLSIDGDLQCWDATKGGLLVWKLNFYDKYKVPRRPHVGGGRRDYGYPGSVLIRGDTLLAEVGTPTGTVMGFDKKTGRRIWASQYNGPAGHTGGLVPISVNRADCIAVLTLKELVVMRIDKGFEGKTVATTKWQTEFSCNISTPTVVGDRVLVTSAYNNKAAVMFRVASGRMKPVWRARFYSTNGSPVIHRGRVYIIKDSLRCLDAATGKLLWSGGSFGDGSCLATADDKIIAFGKGRASLVDVSSAGGKYRELMRINCGLRSTCYPHITLAGGFLCAKDRSGAMVCFDTSTRGAQNAAKPTPPSPPVERPLNVKMPKMSATWPGSTEDAVFVWATGESQKKITGVASGVKPRDDAPTGSDGEMILGRGAMLAQNADAALLKACKASNQLSIEAVITPGNTKQGGPARIISFSQDAYNRNFTLGQQGSALVLRLRTTSTGVNGMKPETSLCKVAAARSQHVIVTYSPGKLSCYLNGKSVLQSERVRGDFSNWSPMHLLFGDEWDGQRRWSGKLQGIAVHSRIIGAKEAAARHKLAMGNDRRDEK
ncbi:MAG: PQQ-binding-like beta-propeller repeat protein [Phycisphaerae bacterium]|nr:PQQ-binding-like beta-propeller repeat protein [Phycisphaerae bacterium]